MCRFNFILEILKLCYFCQPVEFNKPVECMCAVCMLVTSVCNVPLCVMYQCMHDHMCTSIRLNGSRRLGLELNSRIRGLRSKLILLWLQSCPVQAISQYIHVIYTKYNELVHARNIHYNIMNQCMHVIYSPCNVSVQIIHTCSSCGSRNC
jgi:hypothetical protein